MSGTVGIVVLNWNGGAHTINCVEAARAQAYRETFVVLVDSDSEDPERDDLRRRYGDDPNVQLCLLDSNRGYTGGMNVGIAMALARGADMTLLLTHDAVLAPGALSAMVDAVAADPSIGIVGPRVMDAQRAGQVLSIGERIYVALLCTPRTLLRYRRPRAAAYAVGGVIGCVMLVTRQCIERIGMFDEDLFMYYEEVDFCLRARTAGFKVACAPQAVVTHDGMRGYLAGLGSSSAELKARNLLRLMRRWARPVDWSLLVPTYGLLLASSAILYALRGRFDVIAGLARGTAAGVRGRVGMPRAMAAAAGRIAAPDAAGKTSGTAR
jgi:GT2 family glycosyltransferase